MFSRVSLSLPLLAAVVGAAPEAIKRSPDNTYPPESYSSISWWPTAPFYTESAVVSVDRNTPAATTSLTGIPAYIPSAVSTGEVTNGPLSKPTPSALPACKPIQYKFPAGQGQNAARAQAIKNAYVYAWDAYKQYAFPKDELRPLNKTGINDWYGWGVTVVDGIDTAIVMNLTDIVAEQLAYIETIDFTTTKYGPVEIFDTNIRYIGGLLSAYDLLKSGLFYNNYPQSQIDALLKQAVSLANKVAFGFLTPTGIAATNVNFTSDQPVYGTYTISATNTTYNSTNTASTGTFILEWFRLSDLTGNQTYRELTERAESYLVNPNPKPVYPGLDGTQFNVDNGQMITFDGGWHAGVDSFLEYLIKTYQYKQDSITTTYKNYWLQAVQSTIEHLAISPQGFPNLKFISALTVNGTIAYIEDDFTCFAGGNYFLGGAFLNMPQISNLGVEATDSCHQTYNQTLTGLGPIEWGWFNPQGQAHSFQDDNDIAERRNNAKMGFYIPQGAENWEFRPEEIESIFYAHRITGDPRWAEYSWDIFQAIENVAKNDVAYATVNNVNMPFGGTMSNNLDSFFFAEVLKYLYLTQSDPNIINLEQWVFNTECHPLLVQCGIGNIDNYGHTGTGKPTSTPTKTKTHKTTSTHHTSTTSTTHHSTTTK